MNDLKYTDRDVRENLDLYDTAVDYLLQYEGDFEFLVSCKARVINGGDLSVGMTRGVLNCMRTDPRVSNLPAPLPAQHNAEVIPMNRPKRKRYTPPKYPETCELFERGIFHHHKGTYMLKEGWCPGLYRINRNSFWLPASFHDDVHVVGKSPSSVLVHKIIRGHYEYQVPPHQMGWYDWWRPELVVNTGCKYPSWMRNPIMVTGEQVLDYNLTLQLVQDGQREDFPSDYNGFYRAVKRELVPLKYCQRCYPDVRN